MRATIAILLVGLLMWVQAVAGVRPVVHTEAPSCCCSRCVCNGCESQAPVRTPAPPTASLRITSEQVAKIPAPSVATVRTPAPLWPKTISFRPVFQQAPALPFYERDCALLL